MTRYRVIEGSYRDTSDDVAGRWYLADAEGDAIDKRGRGYASRAEALDKLVERLSMQPAPADLVGAAEIAARSGMAEATVHSWRRRHSDFPAPVVILAGGPVWDWRVVDAWRATLREGRPRKG